MKQYPRSFSHIGVSVANINKAVDFYTQVFGWYLLEKPTLVEPNKTTLGKICVKLFGSNWKSFKIAQLSTSDKIGFELFEFPDNFKPENNFNFRQHGVFHYCIQDPNLEELAQEVLKWGGKKITDVEYFYPKKKPYRMIYMEDPFGNVFTIYSHSHELSHASEFYKK